MSLEADLYKVLSAVCERVYPDVAPFDTVRPYITWTQIGGASPTFMERVRPSARNARIQVDVWASTRLEANALADRVEQALIESPVFQASPESAMLSMYEPQLRAYGSLQDFSIWVQR